MFAFPEKNRCENVELGKQSNPGSLTMLANAEALTLARAIVFVEPYLDDGVSG